MSEILADCLSFDEDLSALIDAELDAGREAEVRAHVAGCPRCAQRLEALGNVDLALADVPEPEVSAELSRRLATRVASELPRTPAALRRSRTSPPPSARRGLRVAGALAAAAALVLAVFLGLPGEQPERAPQLVRELAVPVPQLGREPAVPVPVDVDPFPERIADVMPELSPALADEELEDVALLLALDEFAEPGDVGLVANLELVEILVDLDPPEGV